MLSMRKKFLYSFFLNKFPPVNVDFHVRNYSSTISTDTSKDHYRTLGIARDASSKEIKSAFYELSKRHHPDMNPDDKTTAARKFQDVSEAYEVLGSDEKKRIYDSLTAQRPAHRTRPYHKTTSDPRRAKNWEDMDIDYRDFEHFQNLNRRKRVFNQTSGNASDAFWEAHHRTELNYRDDRVRERELMERKLHAELEERKRRTAHPVPTFEQLLRKEEQYKQKERRLHFKGMFIFVALITLFAGLKSPFIR